MKNKIVLLSLVAIALCSCSKTKELYKEHAYNSPVFDENYYTEMNGVDSLSISKEINHVVKPRVKDISENITDNTNLGEIDSSFKYGYLSKLYDGRLKCDGYYQLSRVQLNKTGYGTFFPKQLKECATFGIAVRGGSTCEVPLRTELTYDLHISFYIHVSNSEQYEKVNYELSDVKITTDNGGSTQMISFFNGGEIDGAVGMSMSFDMKEPTRINLTDDMNDKEKEHVSLMLYEVILSDSIWL